jgi:hypothetical protein
MMKRLHSLALVLLAGWTLPAWCEQTSQWGDFESVRLHAAQTAVPTMDSTLQFSPASGDFQIDIDTADSKQPQHGKIVMIAGRVMLSKGLTLIPGAELSALDPPLLMYALVSSTLSRVLPAGPNGTGSRQKISHVDTAVGIPYASAGARGHIPPPWSVEGSLRPTGMGTFEFDLVLKWNGTAAGKSQPITLNLQGTLAHQTGFHLDDSMDITDFSAYTLDYQAGYTAKPMLHPPRTIGEIRRQIAPETKAPGH